MSKIMVKEQRETMSLLFFIKKTKLLKNGEAPICLRISINRLTEKDFCYLF
ncbi:tyrosine type site-specific recombinase [Bacteroides sp. CAG:875]|nr:tyrosine type site-specific recombinase [Bacteroides sp. CAG:875]